MNQGQHGVQVEDVRAPPLPSAFLEAVRSRRRCRSDDLNRPPPPAPPSATRTSALPWATGRLLRRLYDAEAAALAAVKLLLGLPDPDEVIAGEAIVDQGTQHVGTADGRQSRVPEHTRGLLRGWSGRELLPRRWALDVAETFLVLRLEEASRYVGLPLLDPAYPQLAPVAWHERTDPGAELLSWITRSHALAPTRRPAPGTLECEAEPVGADEAATVREAESLRDGPLTMTCRDH